MRIEIEFWDERHVHLIFTDKGRTVFSTLVSPHDIKWLAEKAESLSIIGSDSKVIDLF